MQDTPHHAHLGVEDHLTTDRMTAKHTCPDPLKPVASSLLCDFNADMAKSYC